MGLWLVPLLKFVDDDFGTILSCAINNRTVPGLLAVFNSLFMQERPEARRSGDLSYSIRRTPDQPEAGGGRAAERTEAILYMFAH